MIFYLNFISFCIKKVFLDSSPHNILVFSISPHLKNSFPQIYPQVITNCFCSEIREKKNIPLFCTIYLYRFHVHQLSELLSIALR